MNKTFCFMMGHRSCHEEEQNNSPFARSGSGKDEPEYANEFRRVFFAVPDHAFRLSIKIEIRLANALDGSA